MTRKPGVRAKPTSRDVAALAGVAQTTVSAAMSGNRAVAPTTKARIEWAMRELGYQPNAVARTLRTSKTHVIALIIRLDAGIDAVDTMPYIDTLVEGAQAKGYDVVLSTVREGPDGLWRLARRSICDGIVLMDIEVDDDRVRVAAELDVPTVLIGRPDDPHGLDVVDDDSRREAELLVDDLADSGHRHVVAVGEPRDAGTRFRAFAEFYEGARTRAAQRGLGFEVVTPSAEGWNSIAELAPRLLAHRNDRLGLVARTPRPAQLVTRLLEQNGLRVGVDVSLSALCTDEVAQSFDLPLTNVSPQPRAKTGRALDTLLARMEGSDEPARTELIAPLGVVRRASTTRFDLAVASD